MIADSHHVIARCQWQTRFDDQEQGFQLQEILSYFSQELMPDIIDTVLNGFCASAHHWRIEQLQLDLGQLDYTDILNQLPKRFSQALHSALFKELQKLPGNTQQQLLFNPTEQLWCGVNTGTGSQVQDKHLRTLELIAYFWLHGQTPWWQHQSALTGISQQQLLELQINSGGQLVVQMLRKFGQKAIVRQRIAYQYQQNTIKGLIALLEPSHHQEIVAFADDLQQNRHRLGRHSQSRLAGENTKLTDSEFSSHRWYWVLTHLLVERGSVFNTKMFILSTLKQMASHYNIDFDSLLNQVAQLAKLHFLQVSNKPQFVTALKQLADQQQSINLLNESASQDVDSHWQRFGQLLQRSVGYSDELSALFTDLVNLDAQRAANLLRRTAMKHSRGVAGFSQLLVGSLLDAQKHQLIGVLAPHDHEFIATHIHYQQKHVRNAQANNRQNTEAVWQVVVAYLLKQSSSYFSREQFVRQTIEDLAKQQNLSYQQFLSQLYLQVDEQYLGNLSHQLEFTKILATLQRIQNKRQPTKLHKRKQQLATAVTINDLLNYLAGYLTTTSLARRRADISGRQIWQQLFHQGLSPIKLQSLVANLAKGIGKSRLSDSRWQRLYQLVDIDSCHGLILASNRQLSVSLGHLLAVIRQGDISQFSSSQNVSKEHIDRLAYILKVGEPLQLSFSLLQTMISVDGKEIAHIDDILAAWFSLLAQAYHIEPIAIKNTDKKRFVNKGDTLAQLIVMLRSTKTLSLTQANLLHQWPVLQTLSYIQQQRDSHQLMMMLVNIAHGNSKANSQTAAMVRRYLHALWPYHRLALQPWLSAWAQHLCAHVRVGISEPQLIMHMQKGVWLVLLDSRNIDGLAFQSRGQQQLFWQQLVQSVSTVTGIEQQDLFTSLSQLLTPLFVAVTANIELQQLAGIHLASQQNQHSSQGHSWSELLQFWLLNGQLPIWHKKASGQSASHWSVSELLKGLQAGKQQSLIEFVGQMVSQFTHHAHWRSRLYQLLPLNGLLTLLQTNPNFNVLIKSMLKQVENLAKLQGIKGVGGNQYRYWLWQFTVDKLVPAIVGQQQGQQLIVNQVAINNAGQLLACIVVELSGKNKSLPLTIVEQIATSNLVSRQTLDQLNDCIEEHSSSYGSLNSSQSIDKHLAQQPAALERQAIDKQTRNETAEQVTSVNNAGLVLLQGFIRPYFTRLGLLANDQFIDADAAIKAAHYLQYLVTGQQQTEEQHLLLNKVLLGLPSNIPLIGGVNMTDEQCQIADGLIEAVIGHWKTIGKSSIDGFRGNWLVRNGVLTEDDECWILQVEKRPYDLLIDSFPLAFRQIRLPWMDKLLTVEWQS